MFKLVIAELPDTNWNLQGAKNARPVHPARASMTCQISTSRTGRNGFRHQTRDLPLLTGIMQ